MYDVIVIGCGIVGAATAFELSRCRLSIGILEKENDVAAGTTKANSAIIHAGYDPRPGTLMAKLNREGARMAETICRELNVPYRRTGSLVLAFSGEELTVLEELYRRGIANGVPDLRLISGEDVHRLEPNINENVAGALWAPGAAVVSPWEYALAMAETAVKNGAELHRSCTVTAIDAIPGGYRVHTSSGEFEARTIVNAAGVHSADIHNMAAAPAFSIRPSRGEYYLLDKCEGGRVSRVIFQCPTRAGKGVLVAPTVHGNLIAGPNAEDVPDGEDVATTRSGMDFVAKMAAKSVPSVNLRNSIRNFSGVRAIAEKDGEAFDDFIIAPAEGAPGFIDLAGIKSPGLSAAPAIGKMAAKLLEEAGLCLTPKQQFLLQPRPVRLKELSPEEKAEQIRKNPLYGRVICRCEGVSEGEIVAALHSPIPAISVDGVKRRCGAGMGRCQGGFCGPRVVDLIARERHVSPLEISQDKEGSILLTGETKSPAKEEN